MSSGDPALVSGAQAFAAACSTQQSACRRKRCCGRSLTRESPGYWRRRSKWCRAYGPVSDIFVTNRT